MRNLSKHYICQPSRSRNAVSASRRKILHERLEGDLLPLVAGRTLPFDLTASRAYAELMSKAKTAGLAMNMADGYIAAIAAARGFSVASSDAAPFHAAGVPLINPWAAVS